MKLKDVAARAAASEAFAAALAPLLPYGGKRSVHLSLIESFKPCFLAALAGREAGPLLIICPFPDSTDALAGDMTAYGAETLLLPAKPARTDTAPDPESAGARARAFAALAAARPVTVVTHAAAAAQPAPSIDKAGLRLLRLTTGREHGLDNLMETLSSFGYERTYEVENRGEFSVRGGILDVFGSGMSQPVRLEFDADMLVSMRRFSLVDQLSTESIDSVFIYPAVEEEPGNSVLDYAWGTAVVVLDEPAAFPETDSRLDQLKGCLTITSLSGQPTFNLEHTPRTTTTAGGADLEAVRQYLKALHNNGIKTSVVLEGKGQRERLAELFKEWGLAGQAVDIVEGSLSGGFIWPAEKLAVLAESDIFGTKRQTRLSHQTRTRSFFDVMDLKPGDYVVHVYHGIGRYAGLTARISDSVRRDYLAIDYAAGDKLFIPADQMGLIQRYIGGEDVAPRIERLGSGRWYRTKRKVKESAARLAAELVKLYAARKTAAGYSFAPDTPWQRELEDTFSFAETPDQEKAVADVKADMEAPFPMDRLVCGDVGYGKTEVAVRAAFKAIMDGKQAAVLAPTTLLANQHYETFRERFAAFPVRIECLSRLKTKAEQAVIVQDLKLGAVDLVIGTHRLLQRDVAFKDPGLFIIDEEQRFGVRHKEFLKKLRLNVDVLSLSATPIPRTLNLALTGARDMSVIDTPPEDRFPVATRVAEYDDKMVAAAVTREIDRDGQAFFVHNRVATADFAAEGLRRLVPEARVAVSHGQMSERALIKVMLDFAERRSDVLVSTTIIENGLDMPNVNTLIVDRADKLGLAQLYQLRGRVGRSDRRAYAYFLYPPGSPLAPAQYRRLKTIAEFTDLGSGFRIALRDLEIRGAGSVLGAEQSGFIGDVGLELYAELLREAVGMLKGEPVPKKPDVKVMLSIEAYLPEDYISDESLRIDAYKKIALAASASDADRLYGEFRDRFGEPPAAVENLLSIVKLKKAAGQAGVNRVTRESAGTAGEYERIRLSPLDKSAGVQRVLKNYAQVAKFKEGERALYVRAPAGRDGVILLEQVLCAIMTDVC
ncbi:MAG: transcription-repair coupling factor [Actinomycetota bacterium]